MKFPGQKLDTQRFDRYAGFRIFAPVFILDAIAVATEWWWLGYPFILWLFAGMVIFTWDNWRKLRFWMIFALVVVTPAVLARLTA